MTTLDMDRLLDVLGPSELEAIAAAAARDAVARALGVETFAAANPDGTPGRVAAGELIEAAWGNAVADTITNGAAGLKYRTDNLWTWAGQEVQAVTSTVMTDVNGQTQVNFPHAFAGNAVGVSIINNNPTDGPFIYTIVTLGSGAVIFKAYWHDGTAVVNRSITVRVIATGPRGA